VASGPQRERVRLAHIVEEQSLRVDVAPDLAGPALLDRLSEINRRRFAGVLAEVLDEFDVAGELIRIDRVTVTLGSFAPGALGSAAGILRDRLRTALAALCLGGRAKHEREDRALVDAFEHYLLHGTWPAARAISLALRPADMLAQLVAEDPLALVAMLRRRGSSEALLRRLVRQMPEALLAALLQRLEPVHAGYVLSYLGEVRESHAAERLISANPAELAEMLWTIVLRDSLQQSGLQANRKAFLRRLLLQLARSGGTTLAALIAQLRRGLPRILARRRAPGSLVAILSDLIADEPALLAGHAAVAELAALLAQDRLTPREQQQARGLIDAVDAEQLRWLLRRLARDDPERLGAAIAEWLPLRKALGTIWKVEEAGLPAALEAMVANQAERIALLALAAESWADGGRMAQPARALIARMRRVAPARIEVAPGEVLPQPRRVRSGACELLAATLAEAPESPTAAVLARIREQLGRALAADPLETRQMLRNFAAADAARLAVLLGASDAPDRIARYLLAPHIHAALTALARAARCSRPEWDLLLTAAAAAQDDDVPERLIAGAMAALARARHIPASALYAQMRSARAAMGGPDRAVLTALCLPPDAARSVLVGVDAPDRIAGHLLAPHLHAALTALARAACCSRAEWDLLLAAAAAAQHDDVPERLLEQGIAALARARHISAGALYAQLRDAGAGMGSADRAALIELWLPPERAIPLFACRYAALEQLTFLLDAKAPLGSSARARALAQILPRLSGVAPAVLRARLLAGRENGRTLEPTLAAMAGPALARLALLLSIPKAELRQISRAELPATILATIAGESSSTKMWAGRKAHAKTRRPEEGRTIAALIKARPFEALRMIAQSEGIPADLASSLGKPEAAPILFAAMAPAARDRASALLSLLTGHSGRRAIAPAKLARALALAAAARDWRSLGGNGFATEWVRQLMALASLAEQAALRHLLGGIEAQEHGDADGEKAGHRDTHHASVLARAQALLGLAVNSSATALRRKLEQTRNRTRLIRAFSEAELVQLLALLAPTATGGLLHAAERLAAARRACAAPLTRAMQWDGILAAAASVRPIPQLASLFLDGGEAIPAPPAPLRRQIATLLVASLEGMRDAPLRIALDLREREQKRRASEARLEDSGEMASVLHIANAGLVLASAFLPRLFQSLDYVEPDESGGWRWCDGDGQIRAVRLLQWLVDERTDTPEPQLALNKILCGLALAEPVPAETAFTERELHIANILLRTMLASWPPLAESGVAALRETFFRREGRLTHSEAGWRLEVENRVLDVLIDQLPWGFSTILHPWMPAPLTVQWR
jgi:hypothetical protein